MSEPLRSSPPSPPARGVLADLVLTVLLLGLAALGGLPGLGERDFWPPDEARYGGVSQHLWNGAPAAIPHLNGQVYPDKPPGFFWTVQGAATVCGELDERAVRMPSFIGGALLAVLIALMLRRHVGFGSGLLGGVVFLGTALVAWQMRWAQLDMYFALWIGLAMAAFYRASTDGASRWWCTVAWLMLFCAVFIKGPLALLALPVVIFWTAFERRPRAFFNRGSLVGVLLFAALVVAWLSWAWHVAEAQDPGAGDRYLHDAVWVQIFDRPRLGLAHEKPWWFYFRLAPLVLLPFAPLVFLLFDRGVRSALGEPARRLLRFSAWWFGVYFVVQSLAKGKRELYLVPLIPAVVLAVTVTVHAAARARPRPLKLWSGVLGVVLALVGGVAFALGYSEVLSDAVIHFVDARRHQDVVALLANANIPWSGAESAPLRRDLMLVGAVALAPGLCALVLSIVARPRAALGAAALGTLLLGGLAQGLVLPHVDALSTRRHVAEMMRAHQDAARSERPIGVFRHLDEALPYYLGRPVPEICRMHDIAAWRENPEPPIEAETRAEFEARVVATQDGLRSYLERPGALLVIREKDLEHLRSHGFEPDRFLTEIDRRSIRTKGFVLVERKR